MLRWQLTKQPAPWPKWIDAEPGSAPPRSVASLRITFVNHSTLLIQAGGRNILTDPVWSDRVGPFGVFGPRRRRAPGIRFDDLPPIDDVLLSHCHYDHFDRPTLERLIARDRPRITVPRGVSRYLSGVEELDWWQSAGSITCVPAQHFSGRSLWDRDRTLWCGYMLDTPAGLVYFAGDTGFGPHVAEIASRFSRIRIACLPVGAYLPRWFMNAVHWAPDQVFEAWKMLKPEITMAIHFGTFALADDGPTQAVDELRELMPEVWVPGFGEGRDF